MRKLSTGRFEHIDALRALAVMLVVCAHAGLGGGLVPGGSGVTIFFAISGFIITHILIKERVRTGGFSLPGFYLRRLLKLAPPFLLIIVLPSLILRTDSRGLLAQIFFVYNWMPRPGVLAGSGVVWSLSIEEQFYIVFALIWLFAVRHKRYLDIITVVSVVGVVAPLVLRTIMTFAADDPEQRIYYGTDTRIDAISIGVLAAVLLVRLRAGRMPALRKVITNDWLPATATFVYLLTLVIRTETFRGTLHYSLQALAAAALILYGLERTEGRVRGSLGYFAGLRFVQAIGLASYSIYLAHHVMNHALRPLTDGWPTAVVIPLDIVAGVGAGLLVWWAIERPVERYKRSLARYTTEPSA